MKLIFIPDIKQKYFKVGQLKRLEVRGNLMIKIKSIICCFLSHGLHYLETFTVVRFRPLYSVTRVICTRAECIFKKNLTWKTLIQMIVIAHLFNNFSRSELFNLCVLNISMKPLPFYKC